MTTSTTAIPEITPAVAVDPFTGTVDLTYHDLGTGLMHRTGGPAHLRLRHGVDIDKDWYLHGEHTRAGGGPTSVAAYRNSTETTYLSWWNSAGCPRLDGLAAVNSNGYFRWELEEDDAYLHLWDPHPHALNPA